MAENPVGSLGQLPDAGGSCVTVRAAVPLCPSLAAAMLVVPVSKAVASPLPVTVAIAGLPELQVTARPVRTFPFASLRDRKSTRLNSRHRTNSYAVFCLKKKKKKKKKN